jgi:hypothetical protein
MTLSSIARTALAFCLMLTMVNTLAFGAQSGTSSALAERVADKSGAVIPKAQVNRIAGKDRILTDPTNAVVSDVTVKLITKRSEA